MNSTWIRFMGWSAYANGILALANMVTLALMFGVNPLWGPVNDAISVVWFLSFLPLALLQARVNGRAMGQGAAAAAAILGAAAILPLVALQSMLVLGVVRFEQTVDAVMALGGVLGLWLLLNGLLALKGRILPGGLAWLSIAYGLSYSVAAVGYWIGGYEQPVLWLGAAVGYLVGPAWAFWFGRLLLHGRMPAATSLGASG